MSIVRRAAERLADFTVRHASPGSKSWAEAIAAELDAIEGDWRALGWAFGGLRILFRPAPIQSMDQSMDQLAGEAERYAGARRRLQNLSWLARNSGLFLAAIAVVAYFPDIVRHHDAVGYGLLLAAQVGYGLTDMLRRGEPAIPDAEDTRAVILYYRESLRRTLRQYPVASAPLALMLSWFFYEGQQLVWLEWTLVAAAIGVLLFSLQKYANLRRKLARVETLLGSSGT